METLLPYYEKELIAIKKGALAFAERYPRVAAGLRLSSEGSGDPHIERLIQSVALLTARVSMRLDDGYAGIAEKLLEAIYPQYSQPYPGCAIARFGSGVEMRYAASSAPLPVGEKERHCMFKLQGQVDSSSPDVVSAAFHSAGSFRTYTGQAYLGPYISVTLSGDAPASLRLFVDGDPSTAAAIKDAFGLGVRAVLVSDPDRPGYVIDGGAIRSVLFADNEWASLAAITAHPGLSLLRDFFAFPDKFGFFDVLVPERGGKSVVTRQIHFLLDRGVAVNERALGGVVAKNLLSRCAPVANTFKGSGGCSDINQTRSTYPSVPCDGRGDIIAISTVVAGRFEGEDNVVIPHFFALRRGGTHGDGPFWIHVPPVDGTVGGEIMIVDRSYAPMELTGTVVIESVCCDGDRPASIVCGTPMSDIQDSPSCAKVIGQLITRPAPVSRFPMGKEATWRLVSHLALSQTSLLDPAGSVLKELLALYVPLGSVLGEQITRAIVSVQHKPVSRWLPGSTPPALARGTEIQLGIDERPLVGIGLHALVSVLDVLFSLYAQLNSFTQLVVMSSHTGKELHRCALRTGTGPLI